IRGGARHVPRRPRRPRRRAVRLLPRPDLLPAPPLPQGARGLRRAARPRARTAPRRRRRDLRHAHRRPLRRAGRARVDRELPRARRRAGRGRPRGCRRRVSRRGASHRGADEMPGRPIAAVLAGTVALLALLNLVVYSLYRSGRAAVERALDERLDALGRTAASVPGRDALLPALVAENRLED